jgi:exodeoxyribonuclease VII large subunit
MDLTDSSRSPLLTVTQLTHAIKLCLESSFPFIHLQGEISNFKLQSSGHLYFSLKDAQSQISAVMFKGQAAYLKTKPKGGDHVIVKAEINVYPPKGNYQLIIRELSYVGIGELLQRLEMLKIKLHQMGWFKAIYKKPLPKFPRRIGVVTSPTGAVIQDILHVLTRRFSGFHLILNPVKVQGEGSAQEIALAIKQMNQYQLVDVLIVGRGGGSLEDLWSFNDEAVAEAIFNSQIPIISAVGHETDHCIADYVADVRAPTPSAAAEIVIAEKEQQLELLKTVRKRMQQTIKQFIQQDRYRLEGIKKHPLLIRPQILLEGRMQQLDDMKSDLHEEMLSFILTKRRALDSYSRQVLTLKPSNQIFYFKQRLTSLKKNLEQQMNQLLIKKRQQTKTQTERLNRWIIPNPLIKQRLYRIEDLLKAIDSKNVLGKGYSILFAEKELSVINSIQKLKKGQQAQLLLSDGKVLITINDIIPSET